LPAIITCVRNISADSTDLKGILSDKVPKEQERVKNFRKAHGATKVGEVTVDMVSKRESSSRPKAIGWFSFRTIVAFSTAVGSVI
jgi:hypothetical protein